MFDYLLSPLYPTLLFFFAAIMALAGTNRQARNAKRALLEDSHSSLRAAGLLWKPVPLLAGRTAKKELAQLEADIRKVPDRWRRYDRLKSELRAWNALETSVALALPASFIAVVQILIAT